MSKRILCLLVALFMAVTFCTPAFASSAGGGALTANASRMVWVTDYGADGSDKANDADAIQKALDLGKEATEDTPVTVIVPAGTYYIKSKLYIYSNTTLSLDPGAVIVRGKEKMQMLVSGYRNSNIGGYDQLKNVTITGGVWDGNIKVNEEGRGSNAYNLFFLWHGDNITISNTTLKNCCGDHFIELSGVANSRVENVTFQDFIKYDRTNYDYVKEDQSDSKTAVRSEAIQLDYTIYGNSTPALPYDGTVCRNITVSGCRFINCIAGVGSHHAGNQASDITITGNSFENMESVCVSLPNMANVTVSNNTATNVRAFLRATNGTRNVTVSNNTVVYGFDSVGDTLRQDCFFVENSSVTLKDNRVYGCGNHVVYGSGSSCRLTVENNIFDLSSFRPEDTSAVRTVGASVTASGNAVTGAGQSAFSLLNSTATLTNNRVSGSGDSGILLDSSAFQVTGNSIDSGFQWAVRIADSGGSSSGAVSGNSITGMGIENRSSGPITVKDNSLTLPAPVLTSVAAVTDGVEICWEPVPGAARYRVLYKTDGKWKKAGDTDTVRFTWTKAKLGVNYSFTVRCVGENGKYTSSCDPLGLNITPVPPLPAPRLTQTANKGSGIEIRWEAVEGVARYRVFYRAGDGDWHGAGDTDNVCFTWTGAEPDVNYSFTVRGMDESGSYISDYDPVGLSAAMSLLSAPRIVRIAGTDAGIEIQWEAIEGAAGYRVFYRAGDSDWQEAGDTDDVRFLWTEAESGINYGLTVCCLDAAGHCVSPYGDGGVSITVSSPSR